MKLAVTSPSFSKNEKLIDIVSSKFIDFKLNSEGKRFSESELIQYLQGYDCAIIGLDQINDAILGSLPDLRIISKYGVGLDNIDLEACTNHNVKIGWTSGVNRLSVAELVLGNIISLLRNLYVSSNLLSNSDWQKNGGVQLSGKNVGIIGVGNIGKELVRLLAPFNCNIYVNDIIDQQAYYKKNKLIEVDKEQIFELTDVVTIHTPYNKSTHHMINQDTLSKMKPTSILINSARGGLIDEKALKLALKNNLIAGAAIDVYENEPPKDSAFLEIPNLICTPHIGGNSKEAIESMGTCAINHILEFYKG